MSFSRNTFHLIFPRDGGILDYAEGLPTASAKVLIVDDDSSTLRVLDLAFRKRGYDVRLAPSGAKALEVLGRERVDVIIADIIMPEMDGFELIRRVRSEGNLATIPFIFLTGDRTSKSKVRGLEMGVDDYITKPCILSELFAKVESILRKARAASSLAVGGWDFSGKLSAMPIEELIQILEMSRKSGRLLVTSVYGQADLYFQAGQIHHSRFLDIEGEEGLYLLFAVREGEFHFRAGEKAETRTVTKNCAALLLEALRQRDETQALLSQREKAAAEPVGVPKPPEEAPRRHATTVQTKRPKPPARQSKATQMTQKNQKRIAGAPPRRGRER